MKPNEMNNILHSNKENTMNKSWVSYMLLAIGMMMFTAANEQANADEKETINVMHFEDSKSVNVFIEKLNDGKESVKVVIDGKEYRIDLPELAAGESKSITTDDGTEVILKNIDSGRVLYIGEEEVKLPPATGNLSMHGLSTVIASSHNLSVDDAVTIQAPGVSEDVKQALVAAVTSVLQSYSLDKKVKFVDYAMDYKFIHKDSELGEGDFDIEVITDDVSSDGVKKVIKIIKKKEDQ
jgi:hypothetical protein